LYLFQISFVIKQKSLIIERDEDLDIFRLLGNFRMGEIVLVEYFPESAQRKSAVTLH